MGLFSTGVKPFTLFRCSEEDEGILANLSPDATLEYEIERAHRHQRAEHARVSIWYPVKSSFWFEVRETQTGKCRHSTRVEPNTVEGVNKGD